MSEVLAIPRRTKLFRWLWKLYPDRIRGYGFRKQLTRLAKTKPDVFFIQIGANDGVMADPIRYFILRYHWRGVLVEPLPEAFAELQKNYAAAKDLRFENSAICSRPGAATLYYVDRPHQLVRWCKGVGSFKKEHILARRWAVPNIREFIKETSVVCLTLDQLLDKYRVQNVDLFCIDTEGLDYEIIRQIRFERLHPILILYEHVNLNRADQKACESLLGSQGYTIKRTSRDTLASRI